MNNIEIINFIDHLHEELANKDYYTSDFDYDEINIDEFISEDTTDDVRVALIQNTITSLESIINQNFVTDSRDKKFIEAAIETLQYYLSNQNSNK